jgi:hypothetical protein
VHRRWPNEIYRRARAASKKSPPKKKTGPSA